MDPLQPPKRASALVPPPSAPATPVKTAQTVSTATPAAPTSSGEPLNLLETVAAKVVPEGAVKLYNEVMPWAGGHLSPMKMAMLKFASLWGVEQHWPHACTAAAVQAAWKQKDRQGYEAAGTELVATGSTTLPGPPPVEVTLDDTTRAIIDRECELKDLSDQKKAEMYMQAALMEYGTDGEWSVAADSMGLFQGANQGNFDQMAEALGLDLASTDSLNLRFLARRLRGEDVTRAEVLDDMLQSAAAEHPGQAIVTTVEVNGVNHAVTVKPASDGGYYVQDGEGHPMPPGVEQPVSAETLEPYIPTDGDDVAGGRIVIGGGGGLGNL